MTPGLNNVYSHITAPNGLSAVLRAVQQLFGGGRAYIKTSQFNGAQTLRLSRDGVGFESVPLEEVSQHLLNGEVEGTVEDVVTFVRAMSGLLSQAGIEHQFEVYDDHDLVALVPVSFESAWLSSTVVSLARSIQSDQAFDRLPILADALEEAGCDNAEILAHCRGDGPHLRSCWVVDLLLGR